MRRVLIRAGIVAASLLRAVRAARAAGAGAGRERVGAAARVIVKFRAGSPVLRMQAQSALSQHAVQAQALGQRIGIALTAGRADVGAIAGGLRQRHDVAAARGADRRRERRRIRGRRREEVHRSPCRTIRSTRRGRSVERRGGPAVGQWYLKPPGPAGSGTVAGTAPAAINAEQAWDITTGSASDRRRRARHRHPLRPSRPAGQRALPGYDMVSPDDGASGPTFPLPTTAMRATPTPPTRATGSPRPT